MIWTMTFPTIQPYVRTTQKQKWVDPRYKKYQQWKAAFRLAANLSKFPCSLDPGGSYRLDVLCCWKGKARADLDNVCKAIQDSLVQNDRRILEINARSLERYGHDKLDVTMFDGTS